MFINKIIDWIEGLDLVTSLLIMLTIASILYVAVKNMC